MMELEFTQRENIGFQFVLDTLSPCSGYGIRAARELRPFAPGQEGELEQELDNIQRAIGARPLADTAWTRLERLFMQVKDIGQTIRRCRDNVLGEVELFEIKRYLLQLEAIAPLFGEINAHAAFRGIAFKDTMPALDGLDPDKNRVATFHISGRYSAELTAVRRQKKEVEELIRRAEMAKEDTEELHARRRQLAEAEETEEAAVRGQLSRALAPWADAMLKNAEAIARLDLIMQKARLAMDHDGVKPKITKDALAFEGMTNPMIASALKERGKAFTPISIRLETGATVITGANMGGKSVALKTTALNAYLGACGFFPFARAAEVCLFDSIHILSEDLEDSGRGLSSFGGEIVGFGSISAAVRRGFALVLMDEFARGTNPHEGAALAACVTRFLNGQRSISVLSTHYDGVAEKAGAHYQVTGLKNMNPQEVSAAARGLSGEDRVRLISGYMDYGLFRVEGKSLMPRDAFTICELLGIDDEILDLLKTYY